MLIEKRSSTSYSISICCQYTQWFWEVNAEDRWNRWNHVRKKARDIERRPLSLSMYGQSAVFPRLCRALSFSQPSRKTGNGLCGSAWARIIHYAARNTPSPATATSFSTSSCSCLLFFYIASSFSCPLSGAKRYRKCNRKNNTRGKKAQKNILGKKTSEKYILGKMILKKSPKDTKKTSDK